MGADEDNLFNKNWKIVIEQNYMLDSYLLERLKIDTH